MSNEIIKAIKKEAKERENGGKPDVEDFLVGKPISWKDVTAVDMKDRWLWEDYIAKKNITLLTAVMKAGKSTLLRCLFEAMNKGEEFAGQPTRKCKVLVISEEGSDLWKESRDELKDPDVADNVFIWVRPTRGKPNQKTWEEVVKRIAKICTDMEIDLLVIDTLASFWPIENENDNAQVGKALAPLRRITEDVEAGLLLVHHDRKGGGGAFGEASRGASALTAFVDQIIHFKRDENGLPNYRILKSSGRLTKQERSIVIEYTIKGDYVTKGEPWIVSKKAKKQKLLEIFKEAGRSLSAAEATSIWTYKVGEIHVTTIRRYLKEMVGREQLVVDEEATARDKKVPFYAYTGWEERPITTSRAANTPPLDPALLGSAARDLLVKKGPEARFHEQSRSKGVKGEIAREENPKKVIGQEREEVFYD